ncbi:hypothetical protein BN1708_011737 [Verticillium longisporum]|uniref:Gfd2/YDR514C-like C-terminal domain-containing protein n=1 Tax=Verticillium longisporum TaxID=100787 RepID=A0A0G4L340_VERLO|nr:hypothetical protein BN1708_011737 [Verticillium longisporum]
MRTSAIQCALGAQEGLEQLLVQLRLTEPSATCSFLDAVIVSLDLEVSRRCRKLSWIARNINPNQGTGGLPRKRQIRTQQYSTLNASKDFEDCDVTDFKECEFAETVRIAAEQVIHVITNAVRIQEHDSTGEKVADTRNFRKVIIVGQSIDGDLAVLKRIGLNLYKEKTVAAILDTYTLGRKILTRERATGGYSLTGMLTVLGCPYGPHELHNAGNDATYTLRATLMLAAVWGDEQESLGEATAHHERLRSFAFAEANSLDRWIPVRGSLWPYADEIEVGEGEEF